MSDNGTTTLPFSGFAVLLGNGATPEVFAAPCGFMKRSLKLDGQSSDVVVPNCNDPTQPGWTERNVYALSAQIAASGVLAMENLRAWRTWWLSGKAQNVRVLYDLPGAQGGGYWQGAAVLTSFPNDVDYKADAGMVQISVQIDSHGPWAWTDNP